MTAFPNNSSDSDGRGIRAAINRHPWRATGIVGAVLAAVVITVMGSWRRSYPVAIKPAPTYFTCDDGATIFEDNAGKIAPFDHEGQEAVRAYCDIGPDGKRSVKYLEKWTSRGQAVLAGPPGPPPLPGDHLIKRPGGKSWLPSNDPAVRDLVHPFGP